MSSIPAHIPMEPTVRPQPGVDLLAGGDAAFARILRKIDEAKRSIFIRCFGWRDDETGAIVARHLLHAADRGVAVRILKDRVGMHYEYFEGTKQSFFHKELDVVTRVQTWFLMAAYKQWGRLRQRANPLMTALLEHEHVTVLHNEKRFDHSKLYVFDDETLILGGMGIGDDYRWSNVDFMVEISGRDAVARFVDRDAGRVAFDPARDLDFLLSSHRAPQPDGDTLVEQRIRLIRGARERLTIEMAYMGDRRCTDAVADAVERGRIRDAVDGGAGQHHQGREPAHLRRSAAAHGRARKSAHRPASPDGAWQGHRRGQQMGRYRFGELHVAVPRCLRRGQSVPPRSDIRPGGRGGDRERHPERPAGAGARGLPTGSHVGRAGRREPRDPQGKATTSQRSVLGTGRLVAFASSGEIASKDRSRIVSQDPVLHAREYFRHDGLQGQ